MAKVRVVKGPADIRASLRQFNREAGEHQDRARSLLRTTQYWVYEPGARAFGPGKFVGYRGMDFELYEKGRDGKTRGDRFDGTVSRSAIAAALGTQFARDGGLAKELEAWAETVGGRGVLDGIDRSKWRFVRLERPFVDDDGDPVDATFRVDGGHDGFTLVFESRGGKPPRNTEYARGLRLVLGRLGALGVSLQDAVIETRATQQLSADARRLELEGYDYPLKLNAVRDLDGLRRAVSRAQTRVGRAPGATGGGNPTKRIRLFLETPPSLGRAELEAGLLGGIVAPRPSCWALLCTPERYDIQAAAEELDEDTWNTPIGEAKPGDHLVLWKAKGRRGRRGVVALGEVLAGPSLIPPEPKSIPYWVGDPELEPQRRIRLRYIVPPGAPLWLEDDKEGVLAGLAVANAQGNKLYQVTDDQWHRLVQAMGADPLGDDKPQLPDPDDQTSTKAKGPGFSSSPAHRRAVEMHAMRTAAAHFEELGYTVRDTSSDRPYDLVCRKGSKRVFVEVKGTTTGGEKVILTRNEVAHARAHKGEMVLFVVANMEVETGADGLVGSGGSLHVVWPWDVDEGELAPLSFSYSVPRQEGGTEEDA